MAENIEHNLTDVENDELLYRSVRETEYRYDGDRLRISSQAFNDRLYKQPSVDRAKYKNNPAESKLNDTDGIVSLLTGDIRNNSRNSNETNGYHLDVQHAPLPSNYAHAHVIPEKPYNKERDFEKVKRLLARMASDRGWELLPSVLGQNFKKNTPDSSLKVEINDSIQSTTL